MMIFFKDGDRLPTWEEAVDIYKSKLPNIFPEIISFILETQSASWNSRVCKYFNKQFPDVLKTLAEN